MPLSLMLLSLRDALDNNRTDQNAFQGIGKFPNVFELLKDLMAGYAQFKAFPLDVWGFKCEALARGSLESNFFSTIAIILTDFWGLFQRLDFNKSHERTFWTECVIPIFKHSCVMNKGFLFSWCPEYSSTERLCADDAIDEYLTLWRDLSIVSSILHLLQNSAKQSLIY